MPQTHAPAQRLGVFGGFTVKILRQLIASVLAGLLTAPAWCATNPAVVATAGPSLTASVRGTGLLPGTTLFSGDVVMVGAHGDAALSFGRGSMARLSEETTLLLEKADNRIAVELVRGRVAIRSSEQLPVEGRVADASIRATNGLAAVGVMTFRTPKLAVITAEKGNLLISTAHDSRSISLREGESVELRVDDKDKQDTGDPRATGSTTPGLTHRQWKAVAIVTTGVALGVGLALATNEFGLTDSQKQNLVSPFQFPPH
jgi:hypothetical protein